MVPNLEVVRFILKKNPELRQKADNDNLKPLDLVRKMMVQKKNEDYEEIVKVLEKGWK